MRQIGRILLILAFCLAAFSLAASAQDSNSGKKKNPKLAKAKTAKKAPPKEEPEEPAEETAVQGEAEESRPEEPATEEPVGDEDSAKETESDATDDESQPKAKSKSTSKSKNAKATDDGDEPEVEADNETISYALGIAMAQNMTPNLVDVDIERLLKGMEHALKGEKLEIAAKDIDAYIAVYQQRLRARAERELAAIKKEGEDFLAKFKKESGVKSTKSGLLYRVISKGDGTVSPKSGEIVSAHYKGTFIDGNTFDSSYERNAPLDFEVDKPESIIEGLNEAVKLMKEGDKFELVLPPKLAYGERGYQGIPPHAVLVFEVELLKIGMEFGEDTTVPTGESDESTGGE